MIDSRRASRILATWIDKSLSGDPVAANLSQGAHLSIHANRDLAH
jgi:hypothetical protein